MEVDQLDSRCLECQIRATVRSARKNLVLVKVLFAKDEIHNRQFGHAAVGRWMT